MADKRETSDSCGATTERQRKHRNENVLSMVAATIAFKGIVVGAQSSDLQAVGIKENPLTFSKTS